MDNQEPDPFEDFQTNHDPKPRIEILTCHIKSAWPENITAPALCGVKAGIHGGMAVCNCKQCLILALKAGHLNEVSRVTKTAVLRRLRFYKVITDDEFFSTRPKDQLEEIPYWACKHWGQHEHDWLGCPECVSRYETFEVERPKSTQRIMTRDNLDLAKFKITDAVYVIEPMMGSALSALEFIRDEVIYRIKDEMEHAWTAKSRV